MLFYAFEIGEYVITGNDKIAVYTTESMSDYLGGSMKIFDPLPEYSLKKLRESSEPEAKFLQYFESISEFGRMDANEFKNKFPELFL